MAHLRPEEIEATSYRGTVDLTFSTIEANFNSKAHQRTVVSLPVRDFESPFSSLLPDLYFHARRLADERGITRIVEVCSWKTNTSLHFSHESSFEVHRIIHGRPGGNEGEESRSRVRAGSLNLYRTVEQAFNDFEDDRATLYILSDVIHLLSDPRALLRKLRILLRKSEKNCALLTTPDRVRSGGALDSLPADTSHVREWTLDELCGFTVSCGFTIESQGYIRANEDDGRRTICYLVLSCTDDSYSEFLESRDLPLQNSYLRITAEHGDALLTGGIGTYTKALGHLLEGNFLILFVGRTGIPDTNFMRSKKWLYPEAFLRKTDFDDTGDLVLETVWQIIFFYDCIDYIEFQDYLGIAYRVAQAHKTALFPSGVMTRVVCHGSIVHLENISETWLPMSAIETFYKEKESIEKADIVTFPTQFIKDLYHNRGYEVDEERADLQRHPFVFHPNTQTGSFSPLDTLIFFGKRNKIKGFPEFVEALKILKEKGLVGKRIKKVVVIGPLIPEYEEENRFISSLGEHMRVEEHDLTRSKALMLINSLRSNALCLCPYRGDNHPNSILEVIDQSCQLLAFSAGGIPEVVPEAYHASVLSVPDAKSLAASVEKALKLSEREREELVQNLKTACMTRQQEIDCQLRQKLHGGYRKMLKREEVPCVLSSDLVTVIVSIYNSRLSYLEDLCFGINNQSLLPKEVIFVNDGSCEGYEERMESTIKKCLRVSYRIINHKRNIGLSAARNTGLRAAGTKYVISHDSDDVLRTDFIYQTVLFLELNPDFQAATVYNFSFNDGEHYDLYNETSYRYLPQFSSIIAGLSYNVLGSAMACFRRSTLLEIGGWDDTDRSMWEDWALYMKMACMGLKMAVINVYGFMYRIREDSMFRTYPRYPAECRLARNTVCLPLFEAFTLKRLVNDHAHLCSENKRLQDEYNSLGYRIARKIVSLLNRTGSFKKFLVKTIKFIMGDLQTGKSKNTKE